MTSSFDLAAFQALFRQRGDIRNDLVKMARVAETAERYVDMCKFMRELVLHCGKEGSDLTVEERNYLSVAYKNVIGNLRASWRTLQAEIAGGEDSDSLVGIFKGQVELELKNTCEDVLELLEKSLLKNTEENSEGRVFYLKMIGDYYRYLAESVVDRGYDQKAAKSYAEAFEAAEKTLPPTHPIRLGLALNYSVCFYEILKDKNRACELAKSAFDMAISRLDKLEESDYKDSTLIMQLLRDNLTLWTSDNRSDDAVEVEDITDEEN